jgi:hypothetical protein
LQSVLRISPLSKTYAYNQVCRVAIAIITYFRRHPDAKDNLDGIALWWVDEERDLVNESLSLLIELETVKKDHELYSLAASPRSERPDASLERVMEELRQKMKQ